MGTLLTAEMLGELAAAGGVGSSGDGVSWVLKEEEKREAMERKKSGE